MGGLCLPYDLVVVLNLDSEFDVKTVNLCIHSMSQQIFLSAHYVPATYEKAMVLIILFFKKLERSSRV